MLVHKHCSLQHAVNFAMDEDVVLSLGGEAPSPCGRCSRRFTHRSELWSAPLHSDCQLPCFSCQLEALLVSLCFCGACCEAPRLTGREERVVAAEPGSGETPGGRDGREEVSLGRPVLGTPGVPSRHRKWLVCTEDRAWLLQQVSLSEVLGMQGAWTAGLPSQSAGLRAEGTQHGPRRPSSGVSSQAQSPPFPVLAVAPLPGPNQGTLIVTSPLPASRVCSLCIVTTTSIRWTSCPGCLPLELPQSTLAPLLAKCPDTVWHVPCLCCASSGPSWGSRKDH